MTIRCSKFFTVIICRGISFAKAGKEHIPTKSLLNSLMISIAAIPVKVPELELPLLQMSKPIFGIFIVQSPLQKVVTRISELASAWKAVVLH